MGYTRAVSSCSVYLADSVQHCSVPKHGNTRSLLWRNMQSVMKLMFSGDAIKGVPVLHYFVLMDVIQCNKGKLQLKLELYLS